MSTKEYCFFIKDKQELFFNINNTDNENQYSNLNLNQSNKFPRLIPVHFQSTTYNDKNNVANKKICIMGTEARFKAPDSTIFGKCEEKRQSQRWDKSSKIETFNNAEDKQLLKDDSFTNVNNSSTISLHIATYENSFEAAAVDLFDSGKKGLIKKLETSKQSLNISSSIIQNPFEFPRQQQESDELKEPEISQFKASQKLLNPNKPENSDETKMEDEEETDKNSNYSEHKENEQKLSPSSQISSSSSPEVFLPIPVGTSEDVKIPIDSVRNLFYSSFPTLNMTENGFVALTKVLELFITKITKETVKHAKSTKIEYEDVTNYVHQSKLHAMIILREVLPKQVQYKQVKERVLSD